MYALVRDDLLRRITSNEFRVGDWIPSEAELQSQYAVSQTPVRRALLELEKSGMISRHQGRGSVVRSQELAAFNSMVGLGAELRARGHEVESILLGEVALVDPPEEIREDLQLGEGEGVFHLRRLIVLDGQPCIVLEHYLSTVIGSGLGAAMAGGGSLYAYLDAQALPVRHARETITATTLSPPLSDELQLDPSAPALIRERVGMTDDWTPIEKTTYWIRPELYSIQIRLSGSSGA